MELPHGGSLFPNNRLIINDYNIWWPNSYNNRNAYFMQIERLLRNGITHLDSIGMQFHSFFPLANEPNAAKERLQSGFALPPDGSLRALRTR